MTAVGYPRKEWVLPGGQCAEGQRSSSPRPLPCLQALLVLPATLTATTTHFVSPARHLLTLASPRHPGLRVPRAKWVLPWSVWTGPRLTFDIWVSPLGAQLVKSLPAVDPGVRSLDGEDPLEKGNGNPLQRSHLENTRGQGSPAGYSPQGRSRPPRPNGASFFPSGGFFGEVYRREHRAGLDSFTSGSRERHVVALLQVVSEECFSHSPRGGSCPC